MRFAVLHCSVDNYFSDLRTYLVFLPTLSVTTIPTYAPTSSIISILAFLLCSALSITIVPTYAPTRSITIIPTYAPT